MPELEKTAPSSARTLMLVITLGALLAASWQRCRTTHRRRLAGRAQALPERLQTWEGEGGSQAPAPQPRA